MSGTHSDWPYTTKAALLADVFIHCGDLTQIGGLASFERAIANINTVHVPLKLVIAGNHDLELDKQWKIKDMEDAAGLRESRECLDFLKAQQECGTYYLNEGIHEFELKEGRRLRVYTNLRTPKFIKGMLLHMQRATTLSLTSP
jgi:predicted phosphodiesterase